MLFETDPFNDTWIMYNVFIHKVWTNCWCWSLLIMREILTSKYEVYLQNLLGSLMAVVEQELLLWLAKCIQKAFCFEIEIKEDADYKIRVN